MRQSAPSSAPPGGSAPTSPTPRRSRSTPSGRDLLAVQTEEEHRAWARENLEEALRGAELYDAAVRIVSVTQESIGETLAGFAAVTGAHLIALPTHGRRGLARMALGSVAERVARTADRAVLLVRLP